ncbi:hypothetical protein V6380_14175 [Acinetobacter variabilis]|uniref:hypothetical protein n=1 Tax=Acinetobacter variabilis TaxID=70346 RepID=UPI003B83FAF9
MYNTNQSNLVKQLNPATLRGSFIWLIIAIFASLVTYVLALFNIIEVSRENIFYGSSFLISFVFASLIATLILFTFAVLEKLFTFNKRFKYNIPTSISLLLISLLFSMIFMITTFIYADIYIDAIHSFKKDLMTIIFFSFGLNFCIFQFVKGYSEKKYMFLNKDQNTIL